MTIAMCAVVVIVAVLGVAVASIGTLYAARAQATNAADAAALAAAVATYPPTATGRSPLAAARSAASANDAQLLACQCPTDSSLDTRIVQVVAGVEASVPVFGQITVRAASRAEFDPRDWLGR